MTPTDSMQRLFAAAGVMAISLAPLAAAGINTNVALPVRQGGFVFRTQVRFFESGHDPTTLDREARVFVVPNVLVFGVTSRTTLFGILPYVSQSRSFRDRGRRVTERSHGLRDPGFLLRQTVYARDGILRTSRLALLAGVEPPWGSEDLSSHATDFLAGLVETLQTGRHELDGDIIWKLNRTARGVDPGDEYRVDLAYELRLAPWEWPERGTPLQVNAVIELNASRSGRTVVEGVRNPQSGGTVLDLSPGAQIITRRLIYEVSIQIPIVKDRNGSQVDPGLAASTGIRIQF